MSTATSERFPGWEPDPIVTALGAAETLPAWMVEDLQRSGITPEHALELGFRPVGSEEYPVLLGIEGNGFSDGYIVPFLDPASSQPMTTPDGRPFVRVKLRTAGESVDPLTGKPASVKYLSPRGGGQHAFIPAAAHAQLVKGNEDVLATEGEKKAASATIRGVPAIGLTGNWGWKDANGGLLAELRTYTTPGRTWVVIWDSDASNNPEFADSTRTLAAVLHEHGCTLKSCVLQKLGDHKTGLDDYLLHPDGGVENLRTWVKDNSRVIRPVQRFAPQQIDQWADPQPLSDAVDSLEPWPWEVLPAVLADIGRAVQRTMHVPAELPGLNVLCVASIALGNKLQVVIKPGHWQYGNIFGMAIVSPGGGKTPVGHVLQHPLVQWEADHHAEWHERYLRWRSETAVLESRIANLQRTAAREDDEPARRVILNQILDLQKQIGEPPPEPRLFVSDATSEAVGRRMHENHGAVGVLSSEGRKILKIAGGRYTGNGSDIDVWLAAHSGRDPLRVDRMSKDNTPYSILNPSLAAFIAVQPDAVQQLGFNKELTFSGFLGRWLFVMPDSHPGEYARETIPRDIEDRYGAAIRKLIEFPRLKDLEGKLIARAVPMSPAAFDRWVQIHGQLQADLHAARASRAHDAYQHWLGKAAEHVARIALIIRAVRHVSQEGVALDCVDESDVLAAAAIIGVLEGHARRAFGVLGETVIAAKARALWPILDANRHRLRVWRENDVGEPVEAVKPRDIARYGWAAVHNAAEAERILEHLTVKGWARRREYPSKNPAHIRGHVVYELHPNLTENGGHHD
jgi:hypothetical protein